LSGVIERTGIVVSHALVNHWRSTPTIKNAKLLMGEL
jgi:hypothetical protein